MEVHPQTQLNITCIGLNFSLTKYKSLDKLGSFLFLAKIPFPPCQKYHILLSQPINKSDKCKSCAMAKTSIIYHFIFFSITIIHVRCPSHLIILIHYSIGQPTILLVCQLVYDALLCTLSMFGEVFFFCNL